MKIELTTELESNLKSLKEMIDQVETFLSVQVDHKNLDELAFALSKALSLLPLSGRMMEYATRIYDTAKGQAIQIILADDRTYKQDEIRRIIEGLLANYSARYERTDRLIKNLSYYIDGIRTLISTEKEQVKNIPQ